MATASQRGVALRRVLREAAFSGRLTGRSVETELTEMLADRELAATDAVNW